ncbi:MAG TPA: EscU/YscU/HrcU family type III secretion system export apparatus switch protein [Bacillota bacterium]|nr:EscU/YscU/HrcU family type III secretion system export apparatus switch protein [Bacillota bacterium]
MKHKKTAAALSYSETHPSLPQISALGKGLVAENIIKKAQEHQIPIVEDPSLVELLAKLDVDDFIPPTLFDSVAEVFAFIYEVDHSVSAYNAKNEKQSDNKDGFLL